MKDQNDFFDELIGVDDEADADDIQYFDGDDDGGDDEDDEEPSEVRTAVLTKNGMLALLSLKVTASGGSIVRLDPREPTAAMQRYETEGEAAKWFGRSLATSRRNGWTVVFDGEPVFG